MIDVGFKGAGIATRKAREMTRDEAKLCVQRINAGMNETRQLLLELEERRGWIALGYSSWRECAVRELGKSASQLYRQLEAARIEREISPAGEILDLPERELRGLNVSAVKQAISEIHYEPLEDEPNHLEPPVEKKSSNIPDGVKAVLAQAKKIKERVKAEKREARAADLKAKGETFAGEAKVGQIQIINGDSRELHRWVRPCSVQLVVTSIPYNVIKDYNEYKDNLPPAEYWDLIEQIFKQCFASLCDGGRIVCVVPYGLGRTPWVPFAPEVEILIEQAGFTPRGWINWHKGTLDSNTAWGSFRSPSNPSLRDISECIIVAHKGKPSLDIPKGVLRHDARGDYSPWLELSSVFALLTTNFWQIPPERCDWHPAVFPVRLAENAIRLYGYPGCTVIDPCAGSGSTLLAAKKLGCSAIGIDVDAGYCAKMEERLRG